jgi:hypothetical protein
MRLRLALVLGAAMAAAGLAVFAQPTNQTGGEGGSSTPPATPLGVPVISPPPEVTPPPAANIPVVPIEEEKAATNSVRAKPAAPKPPPPPPPAPKPVRSPTAVMQALDKVTAETMRFVAPVGQPVRYKNLVFTVKACEMTGIGQASPQASAYVVIDSAPLGVGGVTPLPPKRVFKGWLFANSPGLNPFQHPIYDAWLISCAAATPPA